MSVYIILKTAKIYLSVKGKNMTGGLLLYVDCMFF